MMLREGTMSCEGCVRRMLREGMILRQGMMLLEGTRGQSCARGWYAREGCYMLREGTKLCERMIHTRRMHEGMMRARG